MKFHIPERDVKITYSTSLDCNRKQLISKEIWLIGYFLFLIYGFQSKAEIRRDTERLILIP
ncbi:hypothetical protein DLK05_00220 [Ancylomarina longa]|uniref:Uncharacterized protein n=1 Tax=Ancylomarina longa TaxID=2487017 RepID=A0A434AZE3_9BACT|nr:hypothetical protein DLK05_00220 [Ancylomarina longa]